MLRAGSSEICRQHISSAAWARTRQSLIISFAGKFAPISSGHRQCKLMCWQHLTGVRFAAGGGYCKSRIVSPPIVALDPWICDYRVSASSAPDSEDSATKTSEPDSVFQTTRWCLFLSFLSFRLRRPPLPPRSKPRISPNRALSIARC